MIYNALIMDKASDAERTRPGLQSLWHSLLKSLPNELIYRIISIITKYTSLGHGWLACQTIYQ